MDILERAGNRHRIGRATGLGAIDGEIASPRTYKRSFQRRLDLNGLGIKGGLIEGVGELNVPPVVRIAILGPPPPAVVIDDLQRPIGLKTKALVALGRSWALR